ncbi:YbaB/EbfC family DNA-binding protein [Nonomuraea longispora]|uniref:YbaB/EbfC family DNA-binding protein n=1 Tax=Nonomuraea longispora TaxID=1848320 RepID=A0A4R4N0Y3_9ACTN|nr:YbaB/EbfC family nucleoid-associated protein [Nonomuraea longispora]TDC02309.1 YbaB/EbfC family DNA-binding protein [Nonomuraea longispora]
MVGDEQWKLLEQLVQEVNQQTEQLKQMQEKVRDLSATSRSKDGMVSVTVGPRGDVRTIDLDPRVYRKLSPSELSASIVEQIGKAARQVRGDMKEVMEPFVPDLPTDDLFGEDMSFEAFLRRPCKPPGPRPPM